MVTPQSLDEIHRAVTVVARREQFVMLLIMLLYKILPEIFAADDLLLAGEGIFDGAFATGISPSIEITCVAPRRQLGVNQRVMRLP